jgi:hypothetical protein
LRLLEGHVVPTRYLVEGSPRRDVELVPVIGTYMGTRYRSLGFLKQKQTKRLVFNNWDEVRYLVPSATGSPLHAEGWRWRKRWEL